MTEERRRSFEKFNYLLRPSKQVERKLLIEACHKLVLGGVDIRNYTYVGLGSIYYADFLLFHRYLYIDKMICAEIAPIPRRMTFNKPFDFIRLEMTSVSDVIPRLRRSVPHLVWLDYDTGLNSEILQDLAGCLHTLLPGSIIIVTVDADPERLGLTGDIRFDETKIPEVIHGLRKQFERYYGSEIRRTVVSYNVLPRFYASVLRSFVADEVRSRRGISFLQFFNFRYADTAQMLTFGGMIADTQHVVRVNRSGIYDLDFVSGGETQIAIAVPPLTIREKQWLDSKISRLRRARRIAFELDAEMLRNFRKYYKHYPTYYEALV